MRARGQLSDFQIVLDPERSRFDAGDRLLAARGEHARTYVHPQLALGGEWVAVEGG